MAAGEQGREQRPFGIVEITGIGTDIHGRAPTVKQPPSASAVFNKPILNQALELSNKIAHQTASTLPYLPSAPIQKIRFLPGQQGNSRPGGGGSGRPKCQEIRFSEKQRFGSGWRGSNLRRPSIHTGAAVIAIFAYCEPSQR